MLAQLDEPEPSLLAIKRELVVVPKMLPLERLLARFRDRRAHFAVVVDEFGGNADIVTLQHVIAEVIGDMPDEFGLERRELQHLSEDEFLIDASLPIPEMRDLTEQPSKEIASSSSDLGPNHMIVRKFPGKKAPYRPAALTGSGSRMSPASSSVEDLEDSVSS